MTRGNKDLIAKQILACGLKKDDPGNQGSDRTAQTLGGRFAEERRLDCEGDFIVKLDNPTSTLDNILVTVEVVQ